MTDSIRVLLLATNQLGSRYVRLGDEAREIDSKIQVGPYRDSFKLTSLPAVRVSDLRTLLLRHDPHVVHFTGIGKASEGITLEDDAGNITHVNEDQLRGLFQTHQGNVRLVFLNACYSKGLAGAISAVVDYAIGIDGEIINESAIAFASSFYHTLAFGRSVREAFEAAREDLKMRGLDGADAPLLLVKQGVDDTEPFINGSQEAEEVVRIVNHLLDGKASEGDRRLILKGVADCKIIIDEADGSDRQEPLVGDNQIKIRLSPTDYERAKRLLFPTPPGIAPPLPPLIFIGREGALDEVKRRIAGAKGSVGGSNVTVVRGWPGVGKTTLVGVIGHDQDVAKMFPEGVLWTSLEQKPNLLSQIARWGQELGTNEILRAPTIKEATAKLGALLRHRRMLLILDDVWETDHAVPFTEVIGEQCALLVTTRRTRVAEDLTSDSRGIYVLPVLTEEYALKLLGVLVPTIVKQHGDECRELVRDLERLPLAIHVAGRLLRSESNMGLSVTDLIREIREGAKLIPEPAPNDRIEEGKIPTVSALLMKSTDVLDEFTRDCFAFLGVFAPKPATFDLAAMKAVWEVDDPRPIVRKLVGHGLLEPADSGRFQMHRLLVDHAKSLFT